MCEKQFRDGEAAHRYREEPPLARGWGRLAASGTCQEPCRLGTCRLGLSTGAPSCLPSLKDASLGTSCFWALCQVQGHSRESRGSRSSSEQASTDDVNQKPTTRSGELQTVLSALNKASQVMEGGCSFGRGSHGTGSLRRRPELRELRAAGGPGGRAFRAEGTACQWTSARKKPGLCGGLQKGLGS